MVGISAVLWLLRGGGHHGREEISPGTGSAVPGFCNRAKVPADYVTARISKILQHVYDVPDS